MITLRELPMLIGDKIPCANKHYHCLLLLIKISKIVLSAVVSKNTLPYLEILIEEKIMLFKELYTAAAIVSKMHYMVHYASQLHKFGQLINTWTMRQEAKLSFIKRSSQRSNFKNVPKTIAKTHQFWLAYKLECCPNLTAIDIEFGKAAETILGSETTDLQQMLHSIGDTVTVLGDTIFSHNKWVRVQNIAYRLGMFVVLEYDDISIL